MIPCVPRHQPDRLTALAASPRRAQPEKLAEAHPRREPQHPQHGRAGRQPRHRQPQVPSEVLDAVEAGHLEDEQPLGDKDEAAARQQDGVDAREQRQEEARAVEILLGDDVVVEGLGRGGDDRAAEPVRGLDVFGEGVREDHQGVLVLVLVRPVRGVDQHLDLLGALADRPPADAARLLVVELGDQLRAGVHTGRSEAFVLVEVLPHGDEGEG